MKSIAILGQYDAGKSTLLQATSIHYSEPVDYETISAGEPLSLGETEVRLFKLNVDDFCVYDFVTNGDYVKALISQKIKFDGAILTINPLDGVLPMARSQLQLAVALGIKDIALYLSHADDFLDEDYREIIQLEFEELMESFDDVHYEIFWGDAGYINDYYTYDFIDEIFGFLSDASAKSNSDSTATEQVDAHIYKISHTEGGEALPLFENAKVTVALASGRFEATFSPSNGEDMLMPGDNRDATLSFDRAVTVSGNEPITLLRDGKVIAIGFVKLN